MVVVVVASAKQCIELAESNRTSGGRVVLVVSCCSDGDVGGSNGRLIDRNEKLPCLALPSARFRSDAVGWSFERDSQQNHVMKPRLTPSSTRRQARSLRLSKQEVVFTH